MSYFFIMIYIHIYFVNKEKMHEYAIVLIALLVVFWLLWYKPLGQSESNKVQANHVMLFYRDGCPWCEVFKPEWSKIEKSLGAKAKKYNTNDPKNKDLADKYKVSGVPSIILVDKSGAYENYVGSRDADSILRRFT